MISKNRLKYFASLHQKKFRKQSGCFLAEGEKIVREILTGRNTFLEPVTLLAEPSFSETLETIPSGIEVLTAGKGELRKISSLSNAGTAILEIRIPEYKHLPGEIVKKRGLFLDDIRDPGNLGTIIRTADWFGITDIFCSMESVDAFNPKAVQASMGSFARVRVHYIDPHNLITSLKDIQPSYHISGTVLNGESMYSHPLPSPGMIMFGNESKGLPESIVSRCDSLVTIPSHGMPWAESLNVGVATAVFCAEWRRRDVTQNENKA